MLTAIIGSGVGVVIAVGNGLAGGGLEAAAFGALAGAFIGAAAHMLAVSPTLTALRGG